MKEQRLQEIRDIIGQDGISHLEGLDKVNNEFVHQWSNNANCKGCSSTLRASEFLNYIFEYAVKNASVDTVLYLIEKHLKTKNFLNTKKTEILYHAIKTMNETLVSALIRCGFDVDGLHLDIPHLLTAYKRSSLEIFSILLDAGANRDVKNVDGVLLSDLAHRDNRQDIIILLNSKVSSGKEIPEEDIKRSRAPSEVLQNLDLSADEAAIKAAKPTKETHPLTDDATQPKAPKTKKCKAKKSDKHSWDASVKLTESPEELLAKAKPVKERKTNHDKKAKKTDAPTVIVNSEEKPLQQKESLSVTQVINQIIFGEAVNDTTGLLDTKIKLSQKIEDNWKAHGSPPSEMEVVHYIQEFTKNFLAKNGKVKIQPEINVENLSSEVRFAFQNMLAYGAKLFLQRYDDSEAKSNAKMEALAEFINTVLQQENLTEDSITKAYNTFESKDINTGSGLFRIHSFFSNMRYRDENNKSRLVKSTLGQLVYNFKEAVKDHPGEVVDEGFEDSNVSSSRAAT